MVRDKSVLAGTSGASPQNSQKDHPSEKDCSVGCSAEERDA